MNEVNAIGIAIALSIIANRLQSKTIDSNTLFEQTKRSLSGLSKDSEERKKIVDNLKLPSDSKLISNDVLLAVVSYELF